MVGLHRRLLFGLILTREMFLTLADVDLLVWGSGSAASIPNATRAEIDAAGGIALLESNAGAFAVVTVEQRLLAWGSSSYGGTIPTATQRALDAASGIARLVGSGSSFYVVTADERCFSWGSGITAPGGSSAICAEAWWAPRSTTPPTFVVISGPCTVTLPAA